MSDRPEEEQAAAEQTVGAKVNAIIEAAKAAAQEITDRASQEANEVMRRAEQLAAARIEELTRDAAAGQAPRPTSTRAT